MDPGKLPPMRSGIGMTSHDVQDEPLERMRRRLIATVAVMTRKAGYLAMVWATHDGRDQVDAPDVNVALKYQAKHFLSTVDQPDVIRDIEDMERVIFETDSEEDDSNGDDDSDLEDTASSPSSEQEREIRYYERKHVDGRCICDLCQTMRAAEDTWDTWTPEDEAESYLKRSVNLAIEAASAKAV
jgi:hypothetical protein